MSKESIKLVVFRNVKYYLNTIFIILIFPSILVIAINPNEVNVLNIIVSAKNVPKYNILRKVLIRIRKKKLHRKFYSYALALRIDLKKL